MLAERLSHVLVCNTPLAGPFTPQLPIDVPLYLALALKRNKKCKIQVPSWMDVEV